MSHYRIIINYIKCFSVKQSMNIVTAFLKYFKESMQSIIIIIIIIILLNTKN